MTRLHGMPAILALDGLDPACQDRH
jgi:hypothetical protein